MSSFKSSENIQKKEGGSDRHVSDNQSSSVTLNELPMKARKSYGNFKFPQRSHTMTDINPNEVQMSCVMGKPTFWFLTWSDTNQAVQLQKIARGLKFRI